MPTSRIFTFTIINNRQEELATLLVRANGHVDILALSDQVEHLANKLNNVLQVQFLVRGKLFTGNVFGITLFELPGTALLTLHCETSVTTVPNPTGDAATERH